MRLIDADALLERMRKDPLFPLVERYGVSGVIDAEPTAEPNKGHWKPRKHYVSPLHEAFVEDYECSNCHFQSGELEWNYCPICGAKMRGENNG